MCTEKRDVAPVDACISVKNIFCEKLQKTEDNWKLKSLFFRLANIFVVAESEGISIYNFFSLSSCNKNGRRICTYISSTARDLYTDEKRVPECTTPQLSENKMNF